MPDEAVIIVKLDESAAGGTTARDADDRVPRGPRAPRADKIDDEFLDIAKKLRGTLGGVFGPLVGAILDVIAAFSNLSSVVPKVAAEVETLPEIIAQPLTEVTGRPETAVPPILPPSPAPGTALAGPGFPTQMVPGAPKTALAPPGSPAATTLAPFGRQASPAPTTQLMPLMPPGAKTALAPTTPLPVEPANLPEVLPANLPTALPAGGAAAGGAAGGAGAAGPLAIVAAVTAGLDALKRTIVGTIQAVGQFANSLVTSSADPGQYTAKLGQSLSSFSDKLFYINPLISIFGSAVGSAVSALGQFMQEMDGFVNRYAEFSPEIAYAQAQAEVVQMLSDLRRSQEIAPTLVSYLADRTRLQQRYEDAKLRFIEAMMPFAIQMMELLNASMPFIVVNLEALGLQARAFLQMFAPTMVAALDAIRKNTDKNQFPDVDLATDSILRGQFPFFTGPEGKAQRPEL